MHCYLGNISCKLFRVSACNYIEYFKRDKYLRPVMYIPFWLSFFIASVHIEITFSAWTQPIYLLMTKCRYTRLLGWSNGMAHYDQHLYLITQTISSTTDFYPFITSTFPIMQLSFFSSFTYSVLEWIVMYVYYNTTISCSFLIQDIKAIQNIFIMINDMITEGICLYFSW